MSGLRTTRNPVLQHVLVATHMYIGSATSHLYEQVCSPQPVGGSPVGTVPAPQAVHCALSPPVEYVPSVPVHEAHGAPP